jgi:hypothetical protein
MLSTGFSVDIHYCMGKRLGASLHWKKNEKCERCGMTEKKGGCCSDETKFFKLNLPFKSLGSDISIPSFSGITDDCISWDNAKLRCYLISSSNVFQNRSFPNSDGPPIFIRNCNLRL